MQIQQCKQTSICILPSKMHELRQLSICKFQQPFFIPFFFYSLFFFVCVFFCCVFYCDNTVRVTTTTLQYNRISILKKRQNCTEKSAKFHFFFSLKTLNFIISIIHNSLYRSSFIRSSWCWFHTFHCLFNFFHCSIMCRIITVITF